MPGRSASRRQAGARRPQPTQAAALREAHEEIGLAPQQVQVVGELPEYVTVTGFGDARGWADCATAGFASTGGRGGGDFELPLSLALDAGNYAPRLQNKTADADNICRSPIRSVLSGGDGAMLRLLQAALSR